MTLAQQGRLEVLKPFHNSFAAAENEDDSDRETTEKGAKANKVVKVATTSWQQIIKESKKRKEEAKTVSFLDFGEPAADTIKASNNNEKDKREEEPVTGGFFLDFGESQAPAALQAQQAKEKQETKEKEKQTKKKKSKEEIEEEIKARLEKKARKREEK